MKFQDALDTIVDLREYLEVNSTDYLNNEEFKAYCLLLHECRGLIRDAIDRNEIDEEESA
jgi:hypothetical protein